MNTSATEGASHPTPGLTPEALARLARDALLDLAERDDARHALGLLMAGLARLAGGSACLLAQDGDGPVHWQWCHPGGASTPTLPGRVVHSLGHPVGCLWLNSASGDAVPALALEPVLPTLAALLRRDLRCSGSSPNQSFHGDLVRSALRGADTFVWQWSLDNDWLADLDQGLAMLGYAPGSIGQTQADWDQLIHPEDRAANHEAYLRHERGEVAAYEHTYRVRAASGEWRWTTERGRIVERHPDGRALRMVGTQTDVTEQRRQQAAAEQARQRLSHIAASVPWVLFQYLQRPGEDGVKRGEFLYVSPRSDEVLGLDSTVLQARAELFDELVLPEDRHLRKGLDQRPAGAATVNEFRIRRPDGALRWLRMSSTHQDPREGGLLWHGSIEDITEQRSLLQLREEAAAAQAANAAKTRFLAHMSHELRTPLNAVLGFTQLMELDPADPASSGQRRRLKLIRDAGEHLLRMITDLLDLTRIESGHLSLRPERLALRVAADQALQMVQAQADAAQVQLQLLGGEGLWVQADRTRMHQVMLNLLSNAIKYNHPGGRVVMQLTRGAEQQVVVTITDTGMGIAQADLEQVFEPFFRGRQAGGSVEGAGIGLAVTRALVQLMGGQIEVSSEVGRGTCFGLTWAEARPAEAAVDGD